MDHPQPAAIATTLLSPSGGDEAWPQAATVPSALSARLSMPSAAIATTLLRLELPVTLPYESFPQPTIFPSRFRARYCPDPEATATMLLKVSGGVGTPSFPASNPMTVPLVWSAKQP